MLSFVYRENGCVYHIYKPKFEGQVQWDSLELHTRTRLFVLLKTELDLEGWIDGVILADSGEREGRLHAEWLAVVIVYREGSAYDVSMRPKDRSRTKTDAWVERVSTEQTWIIS